MIRGNSCTCPAPEHPDRNPSAGIFEGKDGVWRVKCHGCGFGGDYLDVRAICTGKSRNTLLDEVRRNGHVPILPAKPRPKPDRKPKPGALMLVKPSKPADLESLAKELGVSRESLFELGITPDGADWIVPERDAEGNVIGQQIRRADGSKLHVKDTKRGLVYKPPLPSHAGKSLDDPIFIVEGMSDTAAGLDMGLNIVGRPSATGGADLLAELFLGRHIVIIADRDQGGIGERGAEQLAKKLVGVCESVRIIMPPSPFKDLRRWWVAAPSDDYPECSNENVVGLAVEVAPMRKQCKRNADKTTEPPIASYQPFPVEVLPESVRDFVNAASNAIGCDPSFVALPLLVGLASAIGNTRRVELKRSWSEPAILWGAIVGESGTTKSPAIDVALRPVRDRQHVSQREHDEAMQLHQQEQQVFERDKADWLNSKAGEQPIEPAVPIWQRFFTGDTTIEALAGLLRDNPRGIVVIRDELAGWLDFGRYTPSGNRGAEAANWLELFSGREIIVDRKKSGTISVPHAAVSLIGGIQPGVLNRQIGKQHRDNGLLPRLLLAYPPRQMKSWTDADIHKRIKKGLASTYDALFDLKQVVDQRGDPQPQVLPLTPKAMVAWTAFYNEHNTEAAGLTDEMAAAWSKLEGYAARLALVHCLADTPKARQVNAQSIKAGVTLARWFGHEARRVYGVLDETREAREMRQLVEKIQAKGGVVTVREWQNTRRLRTAKDAKSELSRLADAGFGHLWISKPGPKGGRPSVHFTLDKTSQIEDETPDSNL